MLDACLFLLFHCWRYIVMFMHIPDEYKEMYVKIDAIKNVAKKIEDEQFYDHHLLDIISAVLSQVVFDLSLILMCSDLCVEKKEFLSSVYDDEYVKKIPRQYHLVDKYFKVVLERENVQPGVKENVDPN